MSKSKNYVSPLLDGENIDPQKTVDVKNPKAMELVKKYLEDKTADNLNALINELHECNVLVPATVGPEKQPIPVLFGTKDGGKILPIFLQIEEVEANEKLPIPVLVNMPYVVVNKMGTNPEIPDLIGLAINPFTDNLIFKRQLLEQVEKVDAARAEAKEKGFEAKKVTEEEYNVLMRRQYEFGFLPKKFFEEGQKFMDQLTSRKEEFLDELYEDAYQEKRLYPYLTEEFSVMAMDISDELLVVSVDLPDRFISVPSCVRVYFTWNSVKQEGHYYTIEHTANPEQRLLGEFNSELKHTSHGIAPVEGAELQQIIDLHNGENAAN